LASDSLEELAPAADVYALGAILYHLITLSPPLSAATPENLLEQILTNSIAPIEEHPKNPPPHWPKSRIPQSLIAATRKALSSEPGERHQTIAEFRAEIADSLASLQSDPSKTASNPFPLWKWK
jgi:serine/threonine protein kinase